MRDNFILTSIDSGLQENSKSSTLLPLCLYLINNVIIPKYLYSVRTPGPPSPIPIPSPRTLYLYPFGLTLITHVYEV